MAARDYEISPVGDRLCLDRVIMGLAQDLDQLRAGTITVDDAVARSLLAKQLFNGVRLYLGASKMLSAEAKPVSSPGAQEDRSDGKS